MKLIKANIPGEEREGGGWLEVICMNEAMSTIGPRAVKEKKKLIGREE